MSHLAQKADWKLTGDARTPWEASVNGQQWQVRRNKFPEELYLYSLLIDGAVAENFNLWPSNWVRPSLPLPQDSNPGPAQAPSPGDDPLGKHEYELAKEHFERSKNIPPSRLVEPPPQKPPETVKQVQTTGSPVLEASQLPDIAGNEIIIHWDFDGENTLVLHGQDVLWKEPAYFENYDRYLEVGNVLLKKYGIRLKDFAPTAASKYNLFGDTSRASSEVDYFRKALSLEGLMELINNLPEDLALRRACAERVRPRDRARAELIDRQLAIREAFRRGEDPGEAEREAARALAKKHSQDWAGKIVDLADHFGFFGGFVEYVELAADRFIQNASTLAQLAPIRHVRLREAKGQIAALVSLPILGQLASLDLTSCGLDDGDVAQLVTWPYRLRNLRVLRLVHNPLIGMEGMRAIARADVKALRFVEASGTEAPLYIRTFDWGGSLTEESWTRARAMLVEEFGHKPWLDEMKEPSLDEI